MAKNITKTIEINPPERAIALPNPMQPAPTILLVKLKIASGRDEPPSTDGADDSVVVNLLVGFVPSERLLHGHDSISFAAEALIDAT
jgi:hypothetical protein